MTTKRHSGVIRWIGSLAGCMGFVSVAIGATGCSGSDGDPRFAARTYDEHTEPLVNARVGTPNGVTDIGPDGTILSTSTAQDGPSLPSSAVPISSGSGSGSVTGASTSTVGAGSSSIGFSTGTGSTGTFGSGSTSSGTFGSGSGSTVTGTSSFTVSFSESSTFFGDGGPVTGGFGQWHFDDCSPTSHFLIDSSGNGANAQQALKADCVPGISGLGVRFRSAKDVVQVPDEPQFTVTNRIAVAAWAFADDSTGDQPIVVKRLNNQTSFSLGVHKGNLEMSVVLDSGKTIVSSAPMPTGAWTHVAGMFDGTFVFLFINGQQFGQVFGAGNLQDVFAPVRIGATTQTQYFHGVLDEVFVSTLPTTAGQIEALSCITHPTTLLANPPVSPPVPFDSSFSYDVAVTDHDIGFCPSRSYDFFTQGAASGVNVSSSPSFQQASPGQTVHFDLTATASEEATPGDNRIQFGVETFSPSFEFLSGQVDFVVAQPTGCFVSTTRELMIIDPSVVGDPVRAPDPGGTFFNDGGVGPFDGGVESPDAAGGPTDASAPVPSPAEVVSGSGPTVATPGVWTFGNLIRNIAPSADQAPAMVEALFDNWLSDQKVNGFTVAARPNMQQTLLDIWPRTADGQLDLDKAPLRLNAIVDRVDLRDLSIGSAGEGRFVFGVDSAGGFPQNFTLILEYNLPATTQQDVLNWANKWHDLASQPFPSASYNAALESVTHGFIDRGASPGAVNGSALFTLRTNENVLDFGGRWQLREFTLSPSTGFFQEVTVKETPDLGFNGTQTFADFVNQNAAAIIAEVPGATGVVPPSFEGAPFLGGAVFNDLIEWQAPGILDDNARFHASLNTCNGCHGPETNTQFLMITPRSPGGAAFLSPFLTGTVVTDVANQTRTLNDLARRASDLKSLVCTSDAGVGSQDAAAGGDASAGADASGSDAATDAAVIVPFPPR